MAQNLHSATARSLRNVNGFEEKPGVPPSAITRWVERPQIEGQTVVLEAYSGLLPS